MIQHLTLGVALAECDHGVRETDGPNSGPRIRQYLANCEPSINIAVPWCAAAVQYWADVACRGVGLPNPLDSVRLEAYVQSYADWAEARMMFVPALSAQPGDIVLYSFGGERYDHIGIVANAPGGTEWFEAIEGNTNSLGGREGIEVARKTRRLHRRTRFVRWGSR